jgi:hypothetical protein
MAQDKSEGRTPSILALDETALLVAIPKEGGDGEDYCQISLKELKAKYSTTLTTLPPEIQEDFMRMKELDARTALSDKARTFSTLILNLSTFKR